MDLLRSFFGNYYGLDWATLLLGITSSFLITGGRLRIGFAFNIMSCIGGLSVAALSDQNGFIVYNILLIALNIRGLLRGDRRGMFKERRAANRNIDVTPEAVPVRVRAR